MIQVNRAKRLIAAVGLVVVALVGLLVLRQVAGTLLTAASGADPESIFNDTPPAPAEVSEGIRWLPDANEGRAMEPATRDDITDAYSRAVAAIDRAGRGDGSAPISDYLSGPALAQAQQMIEGDENVASVATLMIEQELRLDFYSDDGSVVAIGVPFADVVRVIDDDQQRRTVVSTVEERRFVMLLEDGNWRVQQIESVSVEPVAAGDGGVPFDTRLDGVNVTSAASFDPTWRSFDPQIGARELDIAVGYGFDSVRVFVAGPEFGEIDIEAVEQFLDLAANRDLGVVVTLFDGSADHSVTTWADDRRYLDDIVEPIAGHPAIVLWDVKNEPDLDDERSGGAAVVDAWLERAVAGVRAIDETTPITVGWSNAGEAARVADVVDVVSFHHFTTADELREGLATLDEVVDRPVLVSEYGRPEYVGVIRGAQPAAQAERVAELREAASAAGAGSMVWQLRDPADAVDIGYVATRASMSYGLLRADGTERPVAAVFDDEATPRGPTPVERLRSLLPLVIVVSIGLSVGGAVWWWVRRGRRPDGRDPDEPDAPDDTQIFDDDEADDDDNELPASSS
ncbi:MAG: cellulase family glycosylhydrolase [Ilumatobacter fluminis]|uniref:cellulase family glycosylhydrolase n=1 Tax=Ilumatobacter fluminis TaxID=467091 RepID=UPI0032F00A77